METLLQSHLLPQQPPYPLVYVGKPYYQICTLTASLLVPANNKDKYQYKTLPVVDIPGELGAQTCENKSELFLLDIREGEKNIPLAKTMRTLKLMEDTIQDIKHDELIKQFIMSMYKYGCNFYPQCQVKIMLTFSFQEDNLINVVASSEELFVKKQLNPDKSDITDFIKYITDFNYLCGNLDVQFLPQTNSTSQKAKQIIDDFVKKMNYELGHENGGYEKLSFYTLEDIKEEVLWFKNNLNTKIGEDSKKKILESIGHRLILSEYDHEDLWKILHDNKWIWFDEYTGLYKIVA